MAGKMGRRVRKQGSDECSQSLNPELDVQTPTPLLERFEVEGGAKVYLVTLSAGVQIICADSLEYLH